MRSLHILLSPYYMPGTVQRRQGWASKPWPPEGFEMARNMQFYLLRLRWELHQVIPSSLLGLKTYDHMT